MALNDDFRFDYTTEYFLNQNPSGEAHVLYDIVLTKKNRTATIEKYSLAFPDIFAIHNVKVSDEAGPITPVLESSKGFVTATAFFNNPINIDIEKHRLHLEFDQEHVASRSGQVLFVQLPVIVRKDISGSYKIILHPIKNYPKLVRANLTPRLVTKDIIAWFNPNKTLLTSTFESTVSASIPAKNSLNASILSYGFIVLLLLIVIIVGYAHGYKKRT